MHNFAELLAGLAIFGVPYAGTLAFFIAILDIVPVLGTGTALIPLGELSSLSAATPPLGIELILLYVFIIVVRNIIEPKIIGKQVGLPLSSPLWPCISASTPSAFSA